MRSEIAMAPRGICWDELPNKFYGQTYVPPVIVKEEKKEDKEKDGEKGFMDEVESVSRRVLFGVVVRSSCTRTYDLQQ